MYMPAVALCDEGLSYPDMIRGNYENKIRFFANPEKIYETFASLKNDDGVVMSYDDFFRSLTPFSFHPIDEEKESYFNKFSPKIFKLADVNQDGKIDFPEFIFFITLLQLPEREVLEVFRKKGDPETKTMSRDTFSQELTYLRNCTLIGKKQHNKSMLDGRMVSAGEEEF